MQTLLGERMKRSARLFKLTAGGTSSFAASVLLTALPFPHVDRYTRLMSAEGLLAFMQSFDFEEVMTLFGKRFPRDNVDFE